MNLSETVISGGSVVDALDQVVDTDSWGWFLDGVPCGNQKPFLKAADDDSAVNAVSVINVVGLADSSSLPGWVVLLG